MKQTLNRYIQSAGFAFGLVGVCFMLSGQVVINEFLASNSTIIEDPDYQDFADWIELFHPGSDALNLNGYFITDNFNIPDKWQITDNIYIQPGGYLLIWMDGRDIGRHASFKLSALGEEIAVYTPDLQLLDSISFGEQRTDISFGRITDGNADWGYFTEPTPGLSNTSTPYADFISSIPVFSVRGGMVSSVFSVELSTTFEGEIRYTVDSSEPGPDAMPYTSPVPISSTTILRARIFKPGMIPGPVATQTYFMNENSVQGKLPVVSIATDAKNLWDPQQGIYVQNFKPLWEIPVNIELFENNGADRAAFNETAGAQINGLYSWQLPQKMLGIYFKKQYGPANLDYPVTHQRKRSSYKNFALRASGSDWSYTLFRDMLGQNSTRLNMNLDIMGFRPSIVYFNGEYMGIHNIREKVDDDYIEKSYNLEPGSFDLVENEDYPEAGDLDAYNLLLSLLEQDISTDRYYNAVSDIVDIENFTDLMITEMAAGNTSISHNVMAWKPKGHGKWRWIVMDLDRGFFNPNANLIDFYMRQEELPFYELMQNQSYRAYFAGRLSAHLYSGFNPQRMNQLIDGHKQDIEQEIPRHIARWQGTTSSYGNAIPSFEYWQNEVCNLKTFVQERPVALLTDYANSYNLNGIANLSLLSVPADAGTFRIDGLKIPGSPWTGPYLKDMSAILEAENKPGYAFTGWIAAQKLVMIPVESLWKYLDTGVDPGYGWTDIDYDDGSWSTGYAQLGYGDGDEKTVIGYGGNSQNRYITSYFRKTFTVSTEQLNAEMFVINLLKDDGAVVYLNGTEVIRANMDCGETGYQTFASSSVTGALESAYTPYIIDRNLLLEGRNVIAAEVHQRTSNSSDLSFDLELCGFIPDFTAILSNQHVYPVNLTGDLALTAVYSRTSDCVIPSEINGDLTLTVDCSPYMAQGDLFINENATLTIDPGVEVWMPGEASIYVNGVLNANGTADAGIKFKLNPDNGAGSWGIISFKNTPVASHLSYVTIEDASTGLDPVTETGAVSAFHADLILNHLTLEKNYGNPIMARYSDVTLTNSFLHSDVTGDLINVKYGRARIENCRFVGNNQPDTDAIDYDEIEDGIIRNCQISDFLGFNSDAIDIGEEAKNVLIDSIFVYNITDKGVSVGQNSTVTISNSIFINCNMGVGVKDSARATINRCVFYSTVNPVRCFEKNLGYAGGNVSVFNSILSNSSDGPFYSDSKSSLEIHYSLTDEDIWPEKSSNFSGNPLFANPTFFNFELLPGSPAIQTGLEYGVPVDMGTSLPITGFQPPVMITHFFINAGAVELPEFITLYNPSSEKIDLSNYRFTKGITAMIPEGTFLNPRDILYLTNDALSGMWLNTKKQVIQWETGRLANEGETIRLTDENGIVIDHLTYERNDLWPAEIFSENVMLQLISPELDNHFPASWKIASIDSLINITEPSEKSTLILFPNPTNGIITMKGFKPNTSFIEIYTLTGQLADRLQLHGRETLSIDLSSYNSDILFIKAGSAVHKVVVIK